MVDWYPRVPPIKYPCNGQFIFIDTQTSFCYPLTLHPFLHNKNPMTPAKTIFWLLVLAYIIAVGIAHPIVWLILGAIGAISLFGWFMWAVAKSLEHY